MDYNLLWKAVVIVLGGTILLRIAGRKSISQMTLAQVVIMVGIGSLLVQPIVGKNVWFTLAVGLSLVLTLFMVELLQLKSDKFESLVTGKSKVLIENGNIKTKSLTKLRLTVDQLEMQLRQNGISAISDVQSATLEPNGQMGFLLKEGKQPATKDDIKKIMSEIQQIRSMLPQANTTVVVDQAISFEEKSNSTPENNIFDEVSKKSHNNAPPKYLQ